MKADTDLNARELIAEIARIADDENPSPERGPEEWEAYRRRESLIDLLKEKLEAPGKTVGELAVEIQQQTGRDWRELRGARVQILLDESAKLTGKFLGVYRNRFPPEDAQALVSVDGLEENYGMEPSILHFIGEPGPRELHEDEVTFINSCIPENMPVDGHWATEDGEADRAAEQELRDRLNRGDDSAWCILTVKAVWRGYEGYASLGGYSFPEGNSGPANAAHAAEEFKTLRTEALDNLNVEIRRAVANLATLL